MSGAKNSALRIAAASLLTSDEVRITNCPTTLLDLRTQLAMLQWLGKGITVDHESVSINEGSPARTYSKWSGRSIRNTLLMLGALLARRGTARVPLPEGCDIGLRPYNLHLELLHAMGADIRDDGSSLVATTDGRRLRGVDFHSPIVSTGLTENALVAGSLARGVTRLRNAHLTPEVLQLVEMLAAMGAIVERMGARTLEITGVESLHGATVHVIPDRIEAMTWMVAAGSTGGVIDIDDVPWDDLEAPLASLAGSGVRWTRHGRRAVVSGGTRHPLVVETGSHPAVHSDMQPLLAVLGAYAQGRSVILDSRYPKRFAYAEQLRTMGADIELLPGRLTISGHGSLRGGVVRANDLRGGAALLVAALGANSPSILVDAWQVQRGYHDIVDKIRRLGGDVAMLQ